MPETQKQRERRYLQGFAASCADFPPGEVVGSERPDFVIVGLDGVVGIEISEVFHPGPPHGGSMQAQESLQRRCLDLASEIQRRNGGPPVEVGAQFSLSHPLSKGRVQDLGSLLADIVGGSRPEVSQLVRFKDGELPDEINRLWVCRPLGLRSSSWHAGGAANIPQLEPEAIQVLIDKKASSISEYKIRYPRCWLLLVADSFQLSGSVDLSPRVPHHTFSSPFERVQIFRTFERDVLLLLTLNAGAAPA